MVTEKQKATQFKPGQSGNPSGSMKLPKELREAKRACKIEIDKILIHFLKMDLTELKKVVDAKKDIASLNVIVAKIIYDAAIKGDEKKLNFILDRTIGPVKASMDITSNGNEIKTVTLELPTNDREAPIEIDDADYKEIEND